MRAHLAVTLRVLHGEINTRSPHRDRWYQRMHGLTDDGLVGSLTWTRMCVRVTY